MDNDTLDLNDLGYFVHVVDHHGFSSAGRAIGTPKSKLSRRIAGLERQLGVRLIQRSTRSFSVTEIGRVFYTHCKAMLVEAEAAREAIEVTRSEPCGVVRVSCPVELLDTQAGDMFVEFLEHHPQVELDLRATHRRVDVIEEGLDVAIRVCPLPLEDSDLKVRVFREQGQCLVASPALLEQLGTPQVPADLSRLPSLDLAVPQEKHVWDLHGPKDARAQIHHQPRLITRNALTLRAAAVAGLGVVQLPTKLIREPFDHGDLVQVLPGWAPRAEVIHAVFPSRRGLLPVVRALLAHLTESFKESQADREPEKAVHHTAR